MMYKVNEIFDSVQGEGSWLGRAVTFIRMAGCNLACPWCDTEWTDYDVMKTEEIVERVHQNSVVITGGEPLLQDVKPLFIALKERGIRIALETNGTIFLPKEVDHIVCSPKELNEYRLPINYRLVAELKYVVDGSFDEYKAIPEAVRDSFRGRIWLQPEGSKMQEMWKKCYDMVMRDPRLRVGVQLHKLMEVK